MTRIPTRSTRSLTALASLTLALSLGLSACGGDDETTPDAADTSDTSASDPDETSEPAEEPEPTEEPGLSKDDFVAQANAICAEGNAALAAAGAELDISDPAAVQAYATDVLVPNIEAQLADIRALGFPDGDDDLLATTLDDAQAALEAIAVDPSLLAAASGPFAEVNAALIDYGLTECGSA